MIYLVVELRTATATFRNPEFQNFHKTLHLPPPTTLVGLAGAALGKSPKAAQDWFEKTNWQMGISGTSGGYAKDLWKFCKDWNKDTGVWSRDILSREILFDNHFIVIFGCSDKVLIDLLLEAFEFPKYALTLGSSDSLAKVVSTKLVMETDNSRELTHCFTPGNVLNQVRDNAFNGEEFSIYSSSEPVAYDLPTRFQYESDYGVRRVVRRKTLSFIGTPMHLNFSVHGIWFKSKFIPVFPLHDGDIPPTEKGGQIVLSLD